MKYPFGDYETAESFIEAIESNPSGHYPIGTSMFWHSGVHIFCDSQKEFEPLISGKVVCYRISEDYKHVELPASLGKEELEGRWSDYKEFYDKEGRIRADCTNETYPISDCFILLKHAVSINGDDFTFHTLYMNLAPACDNKNYKKPLIMDGAIHGNAINPAEESFFVDKIGLLLPAKDKKQIYFDLVVLSKQSIEGFSSKDAGIKAFWGIAKTTGFYTQKQPFQEDKPIKIFIPNWTEFDCEEYTDDERKAYKITLKSFNVYFGDANAVKNRKLTDTSRLTFSRGSSNGRNNEDIWNPTEEKKYISDIVRNEVIALKGKEVDYHASEKFWYIKVKLRQPVTVWTREKVTNDDIKSKNSFVIDGYKENPLRYRYEEADCPEYIKSMVSDISETPLPGVDGKNYYEVIFSKSIPEKYYLSEYGKETCMESLLNFKKWFYFCKKSDSIICDRTKLIKSIIEKHDNTVRETMLVKPPIGIWWKGRKLEWNRLKYVYGSLSAKNDSLEGMLTKIEIRKAVCSHPIEWDKNQFSKLKEKTLGKPTKKHLENEAAAIDLWNGGLDKIFSDSPYFYHPIYFINHLDKAGLFEFNPYEGKTLKKVTNRAYSTWFNFDGTNYDLTKTIVSNPGFAPYDPELFGEYEMNGYACINTLFMEKMDYVQNGITKKYSHEGIDFAGKRIVSSKTDKKLRTPIHSLINGIVVKTGNQDPNHYGKHIIISDGNNRLFLLGHLYDYADGIQVGSTVTPGQTIAYVGNTGNCAGQREKSSGEGTHLHLTVYITDTAKEITNKDTIKMSDSVDKIISNQDKNDFNYLLHSNSIFKIVNPFNYTESRS